MTTPQDVLKFWFDHGMDRWFRSDADFDREIADTFGDATGEAPAEGRLAELQEAGTITVAFAGEAPYSFQEGSELVGASVALQREIWGSLGIDEHSEVVVYDQTGTMYAARAWWLRLRPRGRRSPCRGLRWSAGRSRGRRSGSSRARRSRICLQAR